MVAVLDRLSLIGPLVQCLISLFYVIYLNECPNAGPLFTYVDM